MTSKFGDSNPRNIGDRASSVTDFVEGRGAEKAGISLGNKSNFSQVYVLDVITNPYQITTKRIKYWQDVLKVSNLGLITKYDNITPANNSSQSKENPNDDKTIAAGMVPRNSIIGWSTESNAAVIAFPFFPSHLSLPCKAGELMWMIEMNPGVINADTKYYWMSRVVDHHFVDDVNHSHHPRMEDLSSAKGTIALSKDAPVAYEVRNGPVKLLDGKRVSDLKNLRLDIDPSGRSEKGDKNKEESFEWLITQSSPAQITQYESVPRFNKRPGDVVLEGSNNSLIVLGTDRTGPDAKYAVSSDEVRKKLSKTPSQIKENNALGAGSIDLVVGRGQTDKTSGKIVDRTSIGPKSSPLHKELSKYRDSLTENEGDLDLTNDRSRVLISQRTNTDKNFLLDQYNSDFSIKDSDPGDASIVAKSDKIRVIARSDVEFISTGYEPIKSQDNFDIKKENEDKTKWSSVTITNKGDVINSIGKDRIFSVGPNKDAVDSSKALITLDAGKKQVIVPLSNGGKEIIGNGEAAGALSVFDNSDKSVSIGGSDPTALMYANATSKMLTIGSALAVFDVKSGAISLGGGAIAVAGPPGGSGKAPGLDAAPAKEVAYADKTADALNKILDCLNSINQFLVKYGTSATPADLIAAATLAAAAASKITANVPAISADSSSLTSRTKIQ